MPHCCQAYTTFVVYGEAVCLQALPEATASLQPVTTATKFKPGQKQVQPCLPDCLILPACCLNLRWSEPPAQLLPFQ